MTTVVGLIDKGIGYIASDSKYGYQNLMYKGPGKFVVRNDTAIGLTGSIHHLNLIYRKTPEIIGDMFTFQDFLKELFEPIMNPSHRSDHKLRTYGAELLVVQPKSMFYFDATLSFINVSGNKFWAIGSGTEYALGVLEILINSPYIPEDMKTRHKYMCQAIVRAITICAKYNEDTYLPVNLSVSADDEETLKMILGDKNETSSSDGNRKPEDIEIPETILEQTGRDTLSNSSDIRTSDEKSEADTE